MKSRFRSKEASPPLYDPRFEHDACGVGFIADLSGRPSHHTVASALQAVVNLSHRGAIAGDSATGDGAGILTQIPHGLFARELARLGASPLEPGELAVAALFLPAEPAAAEAARSLFEAELAGRGLPLIRWRAVPLDPSVLGERARATQPRIEHALIGRPDGLDEEGFERALYRARRRVELASERIGLAERGFYVVSCSGRTIVYKGLFVATELGRFYRDLADPGYRSALAVFHQRYSTNTFPTWALAQPFRLLAHNGEINTVQGNRAWMAAREADLRAEVWGEAIHDLLPVVQPGGSDSASLDNVLELLVRSGRGLLPALATLVPEAWESLVGLSPDRRACHEFLATTVEPWDGPAALAFSDGRVVGAALDRNGLRPCRWALTVDGRLVVASEVGVVPLEEAAIVEKGRLGPGQVIAADLRRGALLRDRDVKLAVARAQPYGSWLRRHIYPVARAPISDGRRPDAASLLPRHRLFGYSAEDLRYILRPMATSGEEAIWSMGDDTPIPPLARFSRPLYARFRQRFAQVTNPPIDPLRERAVMSLTMWLGRHPSLLDDPGSAGDARLARLESPILTAEEMAQLDALPRQGWRVVTLEASYPAARGADGLAAAVETLAADAVSAVARDGAHLLVITDRSAGEGQLPMPMPLAVGACHRALVEAGLRTRADIIAQAGDCWETHHAAVLIGLGASAVHPYLALDTVRAMAGERGLETAEPDDLAEQYRHALEHGLLKIMSKMGISALQSYHGAAIFEALGLAPEVLARCCPDVPGRLGGDGWRELGEDAVARWRDAYGRPQVSASPKGDSLVDRGRIRHRKDGEHHSYAPPVVRLLQAVANGGDGEWEAYRAYVDGREPAAPRDLLAFRQVEAVPLAEVEPIEAITRRFVCTAMSLGALSPEAHRTLAIAMNRLGGRSNSGEGGEDPALYARDPDGVAAHNKVKQVASARFGVTPQYLMMAEELEIKMAQGSKPGEGGQLPGHKVTALIARLRHAIPGIPLISPPPHHDIYSIEDLAQLIYDLKQINPRAKVGVKLVSEAGVGTVAAGVAKAFADYVLISGHDGGTGASPLSSIKYAGAPWELGLAEAQQVLVHNDLRGRVRLRTDGGLRTGRDVVIAALLGAEEFGFGTAALIAIGCDMARQCHLNTCPTGIATQRPELRRKFAGRPEQVLAFFHALAFDVRRHLAALGLRSLDEAIGRADLLAPRADVTANLDVSCLTWAHPAERPRRFQAAVGMSRPELAQRLIDEARPALERGEPVVIEAAVRNADRTVGAALSGEITARFGAAGLPAGAIEVRLRGSAGQSFGAFGAPGLRLVLEGEANDYVGKGLGGAEIVLRPPAGARFQSHRNVIAGNTILYGATAGHLFVAGRAGERFAVRNSGAVAVVEGTGDHCCEYMTDGTVVVLGDTGRNFGAGMAAGIAFVLDERGDFPSRYNSEMVDLEPVARGEEAERLRTLIRMHLDRTGSERAAQILDQWETFLPLFWKVYPRPLRELHERQAERADADAEVPSA